MSYVKQFNKESFMDKLVKKNESSVCVGVDITPGKFPEHKKDTTLPNFPYSQDAKGVRQYCLDVLEQVSKVKGMKAIKPNLAYY